MRFLKIGDDEINMGLITEMDFRPGFLPDTEDESWNKHLSGEDFYGDHVKSKPYARARIFVLGRKRPIETTEKAQIDALRALWDARVVETV